MGKKLTYEYVYNFILNKGYRLLSYEYGGDEHKLTMVDNGGYLYYSSYEQVRDNNPSQFFKKIYILNTILNCGLKRTSANFWKMLDITFYIVCPQLDMLWHVRTLSHWNS